MTDSTAAAQPTPPPFAQAVDILLGYWRSRALTIAAELELADHLAHGALHVDDLSTRTNTRSQNIFRLMRALEGIGVFKQVSPRVFANTPLSEVLRKDIPGSLWAGARNSLSVGSGEFEAWTGLLGSVQTGKIAFDQIYGYNFWEYLKRNPERAELFNETMRSVQAAMTPTVTAAYDWSRFPVIADIGGGIGTQLVDILKSHPTCRGILFDLPDGLKGAIRHDRVECVSGTFFERVPSGADAYILRSVLHDWADPEATAILKTVRAATKADSRVILIEHVIEETPENAYSKWLDLHMMVVLGGQERTGTEFRQLLGKADFELERIVPTASGMCLIIGRPCA